MSAPPVSVAWDPTRTRAAFRLFHPNGNSITLEMIVALRAAPASIAGHPHPKLVTLDDLMQTAGAAEGIAAFVEKRPPRWLDRLMADCAGQSSGGELPVPIGLRTW